MDSVTQYKIIFAGDGGVGKSTFIHQYKTAKFNSWYVPTLGIDVEVICLKTNYGRFVLNIWDTAGQEKYGGLKEAYFKGAHGAIVMFDTTSKVTYDNVDVWVNKIKNTAGDIPIDIYGNKCDSRNMVVRENARFKFLSCKSNYNLFKPLTDLLRKITGHDDLKVVFSDDDQL